MQEQQHDFTIYCAHPISGLSYDNVVDYYTNTANNLISMGYKVLYPMCGKSYLRNEIAFKASGYGNPLSTNRAIIGRDHFMVKKADIVYINFVGCSNVSIGSCMELAWAFDSDKHVIIVMEENNIHRHAFVLEAADAIFTSEKEAFDYLDKFIHGSL